MITRYFDNAATTPIDPRVLNEMLPFLREDFGNAHSPHTFGLRARHAVEAARTRIAELAGAEDPSQIVFTSGSTESNNWVLGAFKRIAIGPFEHASVLEPAIKLGAERLPNAQYDVGTPLAPCDLVSLMAVNNETGAISDVRKLPLSGAKRHSDLTQALGKIDRTVNGLDFATFNAHKMYGPKGIGALYIAHGDLPPMIEGGHQENGYRSGTLNVPAIVGFGVACAIANDEWETDNAAAVSMREELLSQLSGISDWRQNGAEENSPYILSLSFLGIEGETLTIEADRAGFAVASGAACSSGSTEISHVLQALGLAPEWARGTVRISFGRFNDKECAKQLGKNLAQTAQKLRRDRRT